MIASHMRLLSSSAAVLASSRTLKIARHGRWSTETVIAHVRRIASCGKDCYYSGEYNYAAMASIFPMHEIKTCNMHADQTRSRVANVLRLGIGDGDDADRLGRRKVRSRPCPHATVSWT